MFCKHENAKLLYVSRKALNDTKQRIYYCPNCRKYARYKAIFHEDGKLDDKPKMTDLKWRKDVGDITNYMYLGGY